MLHHLFPNSARPFFHTLRCKEFVPLRQDGFADIALRDLGAARNELTATQRTPGSNYIPDTAGKVLH